VYMVRRTVLSILDASMVVLLTELIFYQMLSPRSEDQRQMSLKHFLSGLTA